MSNICKVILAVVLLALASAEVSAKGYLATRPTKLPELILGQGNAGFGMSRKTYTLETGKAYSLEISSTGAHEYAFEAPEFFNFIWLRKVEAGDVEIKASHLYELEFENEGEMEIFFVPIKPGTYEFRVRGLEMRGMVGKFVIK